MELYKLSRYNYYLKKIRYMYIFNTKSGQICKLKHKEFNFLKQNLFKDEDALFALRNSGFVVDENVDELKEIEKEYLSNRYSKKEISITIAPTLKCNFGCVYCYENKNATSFNEKDYVHLINFLKQNITHETRVINFSWFGGEPMLCKNQMIKFISELEEFCLINNIALNIFVITNGYILDETIMDFYKKHLNNLEICITLDGLKKEHDIKRPLIDKSPTFDKIVSNIKLLNKNNIYPTIRINIDKKNKKTPKKLVKYLIKNNIKPKKIYLGHIQSLTDNCHLNLKDCLTTKEFAKTYISFKKFLFKNKLSVTEYCYEGPKKYFCKANNYNSFVIDPTMNFYRCENLLGGKKYELPNAFSKNQNIYDDWSPFIFKECRDCKLLPSCFGGCCHMYFQTNSIQCPFFKFTLKNDIKLITKYFN